MVLMKLASTSQDMNVVVKFWPDLELMSVGVFLPINCDHYEIKGWLRSRNVVDTETKWFDHFPKVECEKGTWQLISIFRIVCE